MSKRGLLGLSVVSDSAAPQTVAHQSPLPMEFSSQEYWSGLPFPFPGDLPNSGVQSMSPALQGDSLLLSHQGSPNKYKSSALGDISLPTCRTALKKVCTKVPPYSGDSPSPPLCCAHPSEA